MKKEQDERVISFRLPTSFYKKLEELAEKEDRKVSNLVRIAVKEFLERRQK